MENTPCDVLAFAETHVAAPSVPQEQQQLRQMGFRSTWTPAAPTTGKGTSGGTAIFSRPSLHISSVEAAVQGKPNIEPLQSADDWTAILLTLKGLTLIIAVVYLTDGLGIRGGNLNKLAQISQMLIALGLPFIINGDYNCTPEEVLQSGWPHLIHAEPLTPWGTTSTCSNGARLIDFCLISPVLRPLLALLPDHEAPWTPHTGLLLAIKANPVELQIRKLSSPPSFHLNEICWEPADPDEWWRQCMCYVSWQEHPPSLPHVHRVALGAQLDQALSQELGDRLWRWSRASELFHYSRAGDDLHLTSTAARLSRPKVVTMPLFPATRSPWVLTNEPVARWWNHVAARLQDLQVLKQRGTGQLQQKHLCDTLSTAERQRPTVQTCGQTDPEAEHEQDEQNLFGIELERCGTLDHQQLQELQSFAGQRARTYYRKLQYEGSKAFETWALEASTKSGKQLHNYLKKDLKQPALPEEVLTPEKGLVTPQDIMKNREDFWRGKWLRDVEQTQSFGQRLQEARLQILRQEPEPEPPCPWDADHLRTILKTYKPEAGQGADGWSIPALQALPKASHHCLVQIVETIYNHVLWPWQCLFSIVAMLAKAEGKGERPIALVNMLARIFEKMVRPVVSSWSKEAAGFWDHAIAGSSALRSGLMANILDEAARAKSQDTATLYVDMEKFYDTISLTKLLQLCLQVGFPGRPLILSLMLYAGPRIIRASGNVGQIFVASTGLLAGAGSATDQARAFLYQLLDESHKIFPKQPIAQYVDDLRQRAEGHAFQVLLDFPPAATHLLQGLIDLGLVLSSKTTVVASCRKLGRNLVKRLTAEGFPVNFATSTRDLGLDSSAGTSRARKIAQKRRKQGRLKLFRLRPLARKIRRGSHFYSTSIYPTSTYGHQAFGTPPSVLRRIRAEAAQATGYDFPGQCTTTIVQLFYGDRDPAIRLRVEIVSEWLRFWYHHPALRLSLVRSWLVLRDRLVGLPANRRWYHVRGHISATIATLLDLNWQPKAPSLWFDQEGFGWKMSDSFFDLEAICQAIAKAAVEKEWSRASHHFCGGGAEDTIDFTPLRRHLQSLRKKQDYQSAGLLIASVSGALWPRARRVAAGYDIPDTCPRCQDGPETMMHRVWLCRCNTSQDASVQSAFDDTQHLVSKAKKDDELGGPQAVLWLRGLLPAPWTDYPVKNIPEDELVFAVGSAAQQDIFPIPASEFFVDGSGSTSDPRSRRGGWGVAWLTQNDQALREFSGGYFGPLQGDKQTVPRAELSAVLFLLRATEGPIQIWSDCTYVVSGMAKKRFLIPQGKNQDLWFSVSRALAARGEGFVRVDWTKAHPTPKEIIKYSLGPDRVLGNAIADELAKKAANLHEPSSCIFDDADAIAWAVQKRILAATALAIEADPSQKFARPRPPEPRRAKKARLLNDSGHALCRVGKMWVCKTCHKQTGATKLMAWLKREKCLGQVQQTSSSSRPAPVSQTIVVGHQTLHSSHHLAYFRQVYWCWKCGYFTRDVPGQKSHALNLTQPCTGSPTRAGTNLLSRLRKGLSPRAGMNWPGETIPGQDFPVEPP